MYYARLHSRVGGKAHRVIRFASEAKRNAWVEWAHDNLDQISDTKAVRCKNGYPYTGAGEWTEHPEAGPGVECIYGIYVPVPASFSQYD